MAETNQLILDKLTEISQRLDQIEHRIDHIEKSTSNMDGHISFVEGIYDTCKLPFFSLMNMVNRLQIGPSMGNLPPSSQRMIEE